MNPSRRRAKPVVYTLEDTARIFKCGVQTVLKMIHAGRLRAVKVGGRWRVPVAAVDEFVSQRAMQEPERAS